MIRVHEGDLDQAFAEALTHRVGFLSEMLEGGRFDRFAAEANLLSADQAAARPTAKQWWKHWWCRLPDGSESETDIFLVCEAAAGDRFAVHVENKPAHGKLTMRQAVDYRRRAALKSNDSAWLSYTDFETILLCPAKFAADNATAAAQFDLIIHYEQVARSVPLFGAAAAAEARVDGEAHT